jgi:hypothetical protein
MSGVGRNDPCPCGSGKPGRPRDVALRKDTESRSARQRLDGHLAYDFGWMWGELGLDRPV